MFPEIAAHINIDYTIHRRQLCADFFIHMATSTRDLEGWVGLVESSADDRPPLPTWVPDWCNSNWTLLTPSFDIMSDYRQYRTAGSTELEMRRLCAEVLSVVGIRVGQIAQVRDYRSDYRSLGPGAEEMVLHDVLQSTSISHTHTYPGGRTYGDVVAELQKKIKDNSVRRVFLTDKGHLGYDFNKVVVGDTVHVKFGGNLPFILRESQRKNADGVPYHEIDGAAHVPGIMNGEALDWGVEPETYFLV
ncbi:hypothetical protein PG997_000429 [Apiospora hydei]|uniref:Uncharacterized protein n=1 Tax=Apiospora hydei TaxID=1337664 RepID=A0ABR1XAQ5_9PEZI